MSEQTSIEWTDATWNPVRGCTRISPGCAHCYAETFAERFRGVPGHPYEQGFDLRIVPEKLFEPLRWRQPKKIFVNSMSDLFHEEVTDEYIHAVCRVMCAADWHIYQILTKRSERMRDLLTTKLQFAANQDHIWWGVSVENQRHGVPRINHLRDAKPRNTFLSIEPLLEDLGNLNVDGIQWVIVGGESGPRARPMREEWVVNIRDKCRRMQVPFFFKQWGGVRKKQTGRTLANRTYDEFPSRLKTSSFASEPDQQRAWIAVNDLVDHFSGKRNMAKKSGKSIVGPWAKQKLDGLSKYLHTYTTIMAKQTWCKGFWYIDAFAGPGIHEIKSAKSTTVVSQAILDLAEEAVFDKEQKEFLAGSPRIALEITPPFTGYIFVEKSSERVDALKKLQEEFAGSRDIRVRQRDCNKYLLEVINNRDIDWRHHRAIVFLDPFGMQVPWSTIKALGETRAIEVFLNFPVGMAIQRLLKKTGEFTAKQRKRLDEYFGSEEWYDVIYTQEPSLFGEDNPVKKSQSGEKLVKWYRNRLKDAFGYTSNAALVRNSKGGHLYYLILATPKRTGQKIINDVLREMKTF